MSRVVSERSADVVRSGLQEAHVAQTKDAVEKLFAASCLIKYLPSKKL
jgi:hypothetical protein